MLAWMTLATGDRRGELLALRWEHVDESCFVFSYAEDHRRSCSPSGVSHRYKRTAALTSCDGKCFATTRPL